MSVPILHSWSILKDGSKIYATGCVVKSKKFKDKSFIRTSSISGIATRYDNYFFKTSNSTYCAPKSECVNDKDTLSILQNMYGYSIQ